MAAAAGIVRSQKGLNAAIKKAFWLFWILLVELSNEKWGSEVQKISGGSSHKLALVRWWWWWRWCRIQDTFITLSFSPGRYGQKMPFSEAPYLFTFLLRPPSSLFIQFWEYFSPSHNGPSPSSSSQKSVKGNEANNNPGCGWQFSFLGYGDNLG